MADKPTQSLRGEAEAIHNIKGKQTKQAESKRIKSLCQTNQTFIKWIATPCKARLAMTERGTNKQTQNLKQQDNKKNTKNKNPPLISFKKFFKITFLIYFSRTNKLSVLLITTFSIYRLLKMLLVTFYKVAKYC